MGIERKQWDQLKPLAGRVFGSSLHFAMATINPDGTPHITPIGSLILTDPGEAYFFEVLTRQLPRNLESGSPSRCPGCDFEPLALVAIVCSGSLHDSPRISVDWSGR